MTLCIAWSIGHLSACIIPTLNVSSSVSLVLPCTKFARKLCDVGYDISPRIYFGGVPAQVHTWTAALTTHSMHMSYVT